MAEPFTYHDDGGDDLEPAEREVVCRYYLEAGPQHTEFVTDNADCVEVIDRPDTLVETAAFRAVLAAVWPAQDS